MTGQARRNVSTAGLKVPFGERDGVLYPPSAVDSGLACGCRCPGCGQQLLAKKGQTQRWHFAHYHGGGDEHCYETAVHKMAKQVLLAARQIELPAWKRIAVLPDLEHQLHQEVLERPARGWEYTQAREEEWMVGMRPATSPRF
ncbi:competence protein CoiA family protein [Luteimonas notoginsengisoli]|uniref:Competence protein CoiA-like N-terminal domain-containing protein n=1 Tax=Luteimonas notoginsengisoli TaxID=1578200 RepID=A0ABV7UX57_9GAMM